MGGLLSSFAEQEVPPSVVLVPPLMDSRQRGRSRFAKSSYDRLFAQPQLRILFGDFLHGQSRTVLRFSPPEDPRVSVAAKLGLPRPPIPHQWLSKGAAAAAAQDEPPSGWRRGGGCYFDPTTRMAAFGILPLVATDDPGGAVSAQNLQLGLRFTSPKLSTGAIVNPARGTLHSAWAVGRVGASGLLWGVQTTPDLALDPLLERFKEVRHIDLSSAGTAGAWRQAVDDCAAASSWAVAYQPEGQSAYGKGVFTAAVELRRRSQLQVSFLHHMAVQRNVRNPLEKSDVVGITNYADVGFQMVTDLGPTGSRGSTSGNSGSGSTSGSTMRLAVAWQANKNVLIKGSAGLDGMAAALVFKSWWQPALTLGLAAGSDFGGPARFGLTASVETFKSLRYERSGEAQKVSGSRVTQRHVAGPGDVAYHEGRGVLVPLQEVESAAVLGQGRTAGDDFL